MVTVTQNVKAYCMYILKPFHLASSLMGVASSLVDEQMLFVQLKDEYESKAPNLSDSDMYLRMRAIYDKWQRTVLLRREVLFTELVSFEYTLETAFRTGRTPLIVDESGDDRVCTFFSYQPDVIILEAKAMVVNSLKLKQSARRKDIAVPLENARRALVTAMKFGKLLVIRLGTTAPDFVGLFNDRHLPKEGEEDRDTSGAGTAFFPLEVFFNGGSLFHDIVDCSNPSGTMPTTPVMPPTSSTIVTGGGGVAKEDRQCTWAERLFREEDMRPHRNFALCRREFRVCVASQLPLELVQEYLFGGRCPTEEKKDGGSNGSTSTNSRSDTTATAAAGGDGHDVNGRVSSMIGDGSSLYPVGQSSLISSNSSSSDARTRAVGVMPPIPVGYSGVLPPMEHFQLIYVNKDDDDGSA